MCPFSSYEVQAIRNIPIVSPVVFQRLEYLSANCIRKIKGQKWGMGWDNINQSTSIKNKKEKKKKEKKKQNLKLISQLCLSQVIESVHKLILVSFRNIRRRLYRLWSLDCSKGISPWYLGNRRGYFFLMLLNLTQSKIKW